MPSKRTEPTVQVDPLDLAEKTAEERIQLAIAAINRHGLKKNGQPIFSFREAANNYGVSKTTLTERFHGRQTKTEAHEKERKLSPACEKALVEWIKKMGHHNIPLHHTAVAAHAKAISGLEVGEAWVCRFCTRHPDLKAKWTTGQEKCRAGAFNKPTVTELYNTFEELKAQYNIKVKNTHNMDEKGCQLGVGGRIKALIDINQKDAQKIEDGNHELITIIECVCADRTIIRQKVVFQGKRHNMEW